MRDDSARQGDDRLKPKTRSPEFRRLAGLVAVCVCLLSASVPAAESGAVTEDVLLSRARIYFHSQRYQQTLDTLAVHARDFPKSANGNEIGFMRGRSLYAIGQNTPATLESARQVLHAVASDLDAKNIYRIPSILWAGRSSLRLYELTPDPSAKMQILEQADADFSAVLAANVIDDSDSDARYYDAIVWGHIASLQPDNSSSQQDAYDKAINILDDMLRFYPQRDQRDIAMLYLIVFQLRLRAYDRALTNANLFFQEFPGSRQLLRVRAYKAEALYYSDHVDEALAEYQTVLAAEAEPDILQTARYGLGWSYIRLAANADTESRRKFVRMAAMSLRRFLSTAQHDDPRWAPATYKLAETYVELGEYQEAHTLIAPLLDSSVWGLRAAYQAGLAAQGLGHYGEAWRHFAAALQQAREQSYLEMELKTLKSMADALLADHRPAEACVWYVDAAHRSEVARNVGAVAEARLGLTVSLLELGIQKGSGGEFDTGPLLEGCAQLCAGAPYGMHGPGELRRDAGVAAGAAQLWNLDSLDLLQLALRNVEMLLQYHRDRLRVDELHYQRGRIHAETVRQLAMRLKAGAPDSYSDENAMRRVRDTVYEAEKAFQASVDANPQGEFAASAYFAHGRLLYDAGVFSLDIADVAKQMELDYRGRSVQPPLSLQTYLEDSQKYLTQARDFLNLARAQGAGTSLAHRATYVLGMSYYMLDLFDDAERVFRELLGISELSLDLRIMGARQLAAVVKKLERPEDAVAILRPFVANDRQTALQAGYLALEQKQPRDARDAFAAVKLPPPVTPQEREFDAELRYNRAAIELLLVAQTSGKNRTALVDSAVRGHLDNAAAYPASKWAWKSLVSLGEYYRSVKAYDKALDIATRGTRILATPEGQQEMLLLTGRTHFSAGRYAEARTAFQGVGLVRETSRETRQLRAQGQLEVARTYRQEGVPADALAAYDRVYAVYPGETEIADQARLESAAILQQQGRLTEALAVLKGAQDSTKSRAQIRDIQKILLKKAESEQDLQFR